MPEFDCPSRRTLLRAAAMLAGVTVLPAGLGACARETPTLDGQRRLTASTIPLGAAVVVANGAERILVAQPAAGEFVAFSDHCPHLGSLVNGSDTLVVRCPAHGSQFDTGKGGAVLNGPATDPLLPVPVTVDGDHLVFGPVPSPTYGPEPSPVEN